MIRFRKSLLILSFILLALAEHSRGQLADSSARLTLDASVAGTRVFDDTTFLGTTPLDSVRLTPGLHILRYVSMDARSWFHAPVAETLTVAPGERVVRRVVLPEAMGVHPPPSEGGLFGGSSFGGGSSEHGSALAGIQTQSGIPVYAAGSSAIVTGVIAAYFKIKADNSYAQYQQNNDPTILNMVHSYDRSAGIALVACQVSMLALTYLLLSR